MTVRLIEKVIKWQRQFNAKENQQDSIDGRSSLGYCDHLQTCLPDTLLTSQK